MRLKQSSLCFEFAILPGTNYQMSFVFPVTDSDIRRSAHRQLFRDHHTAPGTLVVDELGLRHGSARADIAIVNGRLVAYEIKSERDSLHRLKNQVAAYDAIFDNITIIVGPKHERRVAQRIPRHWGIIIAQRGKLGAVRFEFQRKARMNRRIDLFAIAQLLWRTEVMGLLQSTGVSNQLLRQPRTALYRHLVSSMPAQTLKAAVRNCLRTRRNWRCPQQSFQCDGSCRPRAKL